MVSFLGGGEEREREGEWRGEEVGEQRERVTQTSVFTFMQSSKVVFEKMTLFAQCLPSALPKVTTRHLG